MAIAASVLITAAKRRAFGSAGSQKVSDAMLLEELSYQDQMTVQMFSQIAPDLLANVTGNLTATDAGNANGYTLQPGMHYRDFVHQNVNDDIYTPINMLARRHRDNRRVGAPSAMLRTSSLGGVFYPIDPRGRRWQTGDSREYFEPDKGHKVSYSYIPVPTPLVALSDTLSSPDMAREIFVTALEVRVLLSNPKTDEAWQLKVQSAVAALTEAKTSLQMQAYKFMQPQGQPGSQGRSGRSDSIWVNDEVSG